MLNAQDLLTLMAEALVTGAVALYGSLFVQGLIVRHRRPSKPVQFVQPAETHQLVQVTESAPTTIQSAGAAAVSDPVVTLLLPLPLVQEVVQEAIAPDKGTVDISSMSKKRTKRRQQSLASTRTSSR
ncbi:hypothetical protein [Leptolyngbya ohadii]|uniref:hypothetical protein n=1 Tax=Leptolyngbya ohadii TaxID=1962290 RepID=UPI000B59FFCE|nr:hypothetical protein [Leptolyngbya ohadii]